VKAPTPDVKATRRLIFGGGSHEERLATSAGPPGTLLITLLPARAELKHPGRSLRRKNTPLPCRVTIWVFAAGGRASGSATGS
jgi:hypothetical protein